MRETTDPRFIEYGQDLDGLTVARQAPPAGTASFSATYIGPGGWGFDPGSKSGVARVVSQLLTSGTERQSRASLARALDRAGATLASDCAPESAEVTIWGPSADWEKLLEILAEVVVTPRFAVADLQRVRRQLLERQLRELSQPASRAEYELFRAIYPEGHPYRSTGLGDRRSVVRLTPEHLRRFHRDRYTRNGSLLLVTVPAAFGTVESAVRRSFAELPDGRTPELRFPPVRSTRPRIVKVDLPGRSQVELRIGGDSIARSDPEYPAAFLANEILGGRAQLSRLFQRVRERGGLVYHASSELEAMRYGGYFEVGAGTGADRWRKVADQLTNELARIGERSPTTAELRMVRESSVGELPLSLESTADAHEIALETAYHRLPGDYLLRWPALLRAVRPRDVRRAAETAMDRDHAVTVLAGPLDTSVP